MKWALRNKTRKQRVVTTARRLRPQERSTSTPPPRPLLEDLSLMPVSPEPSKGSRPMDVVSVSGSFSSLSYGAKSLKDGPHTPVG